MHLGVSLAHTIAGLPFMEIQKQQVDKQKLILIASWYVDFVATVEMSSLLLSIKGSTDVTWSVGYTTAAP